MTYLILKLVIYDKLEQMTCWPIYWSVVLSDVFLPTPIFEKISHTLILNSSTFFSTIFDFTMRASYISYIFYIFLACFRLTSSILSR